MSDALLFAFEFDGEGGATQINDIESAGEKIADDQLAWIHLDAQCDETKNWLEKELSYLDNYVVEALLAEETRPRVSEIDEGAIIILRGANLNKDAKPEDMVSIRLWVDSHRIISVQKRQLKAVADIKNKLKSGTGPRNAGQFISTLTSKLFERLEPIISDLDDKIDDAEEQLLDEPDLSLREDIIDIRRKAIILRRYMAPQKDAIGQLRISEQLWLLASDKRSLHESYDRVLRYVEDLDAIRERAQIVKDELANILSDRLNKNMYVLSVVAAVFLPLGFLTGLFGINIGGMPGVDDENGFIIFSGILLIVVVLQIIIFKKLKWF